MIGKVALVTKDIFSESKNHIIELLEKKKIDYIENNEMVKNINILFTDDIDVAKKVITSNAKSKVFLISECSDSLLPEAYIFHPDNVGYIEGIIDFLLKNNEIDQKINIYNQIFNNYIGLLAQIKKELSIANKTLKQVNNIFDGGHRQVIELLEIFNIFLEVDNKLFGSTDSKDFISKLNIEIKKSGYGDKIEYLSLDELTNSLLKDSHCRIYPLMSGNTGFIKINSDNGRQVPMSDFTVILLVKLCNEFFNKLESKNQLRKNNTIYEKVFSILPYPLALFLEHGELVLHNQNFLALNILPNICFNFNNEEKFEHEGPIYKIHKKMFSQNGEKYVYFIFTTDKEMSEKTEKNLSSSELGIISSSIAHELNNPLAGILAALELILLEDDLEEEILQSTKAMKDSAKRCKELVEIFLGFSKKDPRYLKQGDINTAFTQALGLLRFRMIESNVRLEMQVRETSKQFSKEPNVSVLAMIFYLVLGELITSASKLGLISSETTQTSEVFVTGHLIIEEDSLIIQLENTVGDINILSKMKLLKYLIGLENLSLELSDQSILLRSFSNQTKSLG